MRFLHLLGLCLATFFVHAAPTENEPRSEKPVLKLPYGTFEATSEKDGVWTFKNIPYAAPPTGELRWAKPAPPLVKKGTQRGYRKGPACLQGVVHGLNLVADLNETPIGTAINSMFGNTDELPVHPRRGESEDCLYLDLQVPNAALEDPSLKLPVAVFIYGGGFALGDKDLLEPIFPLYDGHGLIDQSDNNMIFITFNYRVGAFGFLAGSTMEKDGLPNAGLWDQRTVFEWVRSHISLVGGDPNKVTAIGESAGASSIMFHLVAEGGTLDPLFQRAILLSPAYQPMWDRAGTVEEQFQNFAKLAGCENKGLKCLRSVDTKTLRKANKDLMDMQTPGTFAVGPTPDGSFIRQIPTAELSLGRIWPIESLILSHCEKEALFFVNGKVKHDHEFDEFLASLLPNSSLSNGIMERITQTYPALSSEESRYDHQADRLEEVIRDSCMTCHVRYLAEALGPDKVWVMQYSVFPGWHATDLFPLFYSLSFDLSSFEDAMATAAGIGTGIFLGGLSKAYKSYMTSYIRTGDPNEQRISRWDNKGFHGTEEWRRPELENGDGHMERVLNVDIGWKDFFEEIEDTQLPKDKCDFWKQFALAGTVAGGYVPPGEVLDQTWVNATGASDNYR